MADWHALLLEDLGPPTAPPWRTADLRAASHGLADFHRHSLGLELPQLLPRDKHGHFASIWAGLSADGSLARLPSLAGEASGEVERWLSESVPALRRAAEYLVEAPPPQTLLHFDVRSDNLRIVEGQLRLFDWNWASVGPAELDLAAFAQSVTVEGGGDPERVIALYAEHLPVRDEVVTSSAASIAPYLLRGFWAPEVPGLPRLREFQRRQAVVTLEWAARRLSLDLPRWARRLADSYPPAATT